MKNISTMFIALVVIVVLGLGTWYVFLADDSTTNNDYYYPTPTESQINKGTTGQNDQLGDRYVAFSNGILEDTSGRRVLFFYANWCPTCRPADASLQANQNQIPNDVTVVRVNYNDTQTEQAERDLAERYGVTYQHTFVQIDEQGNQVTTWNGGQLEELLQNIV